MWNRILLWTHLQQQQPARPKQLLRLYTNRWSSLSCCAATTSHHHHHHCGSTATIIQHGATAPSIVTPKQRAACFLHYSRLSTRRNESSTQQSQSQGQGQQQQCILLAPDPTLVNARNCPSDFTESSAVVYRNVISDEEAMSLVQDLSVKLKRRRYERGHWDAVIIKYKEMELIDEDSVLSNTSKAALQRIRQLLEQQHLQHKIKQQQQNPTTSLWLPCHVIELAKTGELNAHVDSVRFSGDIVAGLSLQSDSIMRLLLPTVDNQKGGESLNHDDIKNNNNHHHHDIETNIVAAPLTGNSSEHKGDKSSSSSSSSMSFVDLHLLPKSLYVLSGPSRYRYTHELLPDGTTFFVSKSSACADNGDAESDNCNNNNGRIVHRQDRLSIIFRDARQGKPVDDDDQ